MKNKFLLLTFLAMSCFGSNMTKVNAQPPVTPITYVTAYEIRWDAFPCRVHRYFESSGQAMLYLMLSVDPYYYVGPVSVPSTYPLAWPGWEVLECVSTEP